MLMYSSHSCPSKQLINSKCVVRLVSVCWSDQWREKILTNYFYDSILNSTCNTFGTQDSLLPYMYLTCNPSCESWAFRSSLSLNIVPPIPSLTVVSWCCDQFVLNALNIFDNVGEGDIGIKIVGGVAMVIILLSQGKRQFATARHF